MPISVKHGGGIDALSGLLRGQGAYATRESQLRGQDFARIYGQQKDLRSRESIARGNRNIQAGIASARVSAQRQMQSKALSAQRSNQMRQIEAQSARDKQAADNAYKRAAVSAGLQSELQEQAFDQRIQAMEEAARIKSQQTKLIHGEQAKRDIATANATDSWAEKTFRAGEIDEPTYKQAKLKASALREGALPSAVPDPETKPPEGYEPYASGVLEDGRPFFVGHDRKMTVGKVADTREGMEFAAAEKRQEAAAAERKERVDRQREWAKDRSMYILKRTQDTGDDNANVSASKAGSEFDAARPMLGPGSPFRPQEDDSQQVTPQIQQAPAASELTPDGKKAPLPKDWYLDGNWWEHSAMKGVEVLQSDMRYPPEIGSARVIVRHYKSKYVGKKMPKGIKQQVADYEEKIRRHETERFRKQFHRG